MTLADFIYETIKEILQEENKKENIYKKNSVEKNSCSKKTSKKRVITESFILEEIKAGREITISENDIVTPLAKDILKKIQ